MVTLNLSVWVNRRREVTLIHRGLNKNGCSTRLGSRTSRWSMWLTIGSVVWI